MITFIEAAQILGVGRAYIRKLITAGYLEEINHEGKRYLDLNHLLEFLKRCGGAVSIDQSQRITIHEIFLKYPGKGLSIVSLISLIIEGRLTPLSRKPEASFSDITLILESWLK
jgi:hypothetical protein